MLQTKQQKQMQQAGMVSPDFMGSKSYQSTVDTFANQNNNGDKQNFKSMPAMVSPKAASQSSSIQSASKHNIYATVVTPTLATPNKTPRNQSPMTDPLKSPFVTSMALLDSKLASLKKVDNRLHDRIESMRAWLDGSVEDSFDGELVFDEWDLEGSMAKMDAVSQTIHPRKNPSVDVTPDPDEKVDVKESQSTALLRCSSPLRNKTDADESSSVSPSAEADEELNETIKMTCSSDQYRMKTIVDVSLNSAENNPDVNLQPLENTADEFVDTPRIEESLIGLSSNISHQSLVANIETDPHQKLNEVAFDENTTSQMSMRRATFESFSNIENLSKNIAITGTLATNRALFSPVEANQDQSYYFTPYSQSVGLDAGEESSNADHINTPNSQSNSICCESERSDFADSEHDEDENENSGGTPNISSSSSVHNTSIPDTSIPLVDTSSPQNFRDYTLSQQNPCNSPIQPKNLYSNYVGASSSDECLPGGQTTGSECEKQLLNLVAELQETTQSSNVTSHCVDSWTSEREQLLALIAKLRCELTEATNSLDAVLQERDALKFERDCLLQTNRPLSASKLECNNPHCQNQDDEKAPACLHECIFYDDEPNTNSLESDDEDILEQAIELVISTTKSQSPTLQSPDGDLGLSEDLAKLQLHPRILLNRYEEQISSLKAENESLKAQLEASSPKQLTPSSLSGRSQCVNLETLFSNSSCENEIRSIQSSEQSVSSHTVQRDDLEKEFKKAIQSRDKLIFLHEQLIEKHSDLESHLENVNAEKDGALSELQQASSLLSLLEASKETLMFDELQNEKAAIEQQRDELRTEIDSLTVRMMEAESQRDAAEAKLNTADETIQALKSKLEEAKRDYNIMLDQLRTVEHKLTVAKSEVDLLVEEKNKQEEKIHELLSLLSRIDEEKAGLEKSLDDVSFTIDHLHQQIELKEATILSLHESILSLKNEMSSCSVRLDEAETKLRGAVTANEVAFNDLNELNQKQVDTNHHLSAALELAEQQSLLFTAVKDEKQSMQESLESTVSELTERVDVLSNQLAFKNSEIANLQDEKSSIEAHVEFLMEQGKDLVAQYKTVAAEKDSLELSLFKARQQLEATDQCLLHEAKALPQSTEVQDAESCEANNEAELLSTDDDDIDSLLLVLQQKLRAGRASKSQDTELVHLCEKLSDAELSELNTDRRRLVEDSVELNQKIAMVMAENETLVAMLNSCSADSSSSEAIVLDDECGVEAVNCTAYSSTYHSEAYANARCIENLQAIIASLAAALVKLKVREMDTQKAMAELEGRELYYHQIICKFREFLLELTDQQRSMSECVLIEKNQTSTELLKFREHASQMLAELSSKVKSFNEQIVRLQLANLQQNEIFEALSPKSISLDDEITRLQVEKQDLLDQNDRLTDVVAELKENTKRLEIEKDALAIKINKLSSEHHEADLAFDSRNQEISDLDEQLQAMKNELVCKDAYFSHVVTQLNDSHLRKTQEDSERIAELKLENDTLREKQLNWLRGNETTALLKAQLEAVASQKDDMERFMTASQENMADKINGLLSTISSLKSERDSLASQLHDCKESTIHISQRVQSSQSESELAKKLRQQLESQLNAKAEEAEVLNQTVLSQTARIEELCLQIRYIAQEREHEKNAMSQIHAKAHSLASERDDLLSKLIAATDEANALRAENEKLKHNIRPSSSGTDCTDKTFSSCEYVGTVCEDEAPERDILLTDILQISDQDIHTVRNKMSELHSIISEVQEERSSLKQEIKHLRQFKDSYERLKHESSDLVHRDEVERMLQRTSQSYSSLLIESQNEILRLNKELEFRDQPRVTNFTSPFTATSASNCPKFEISLETPRISNSAPKSHTKPSRPRPKSKSPRAPTQVSSKERFEVKKGTSIFTLFRDTKKTGRKDNIKYRDANKDKDARSINSSEPISPGEKRKREHAEQMRQAMRRRCEI